MLEHDSRQAARTDTDGYVALADQNRSMWDVQQIADGLRCLEKAVRLRRPGQYQLQAAITALHIQAADQDATDWNQIADLYAAPSQITSSAVVEINHAAAVGFAQGPRAGLERIRPLLADPALQQYSPLHATHADLLNRSGDVQAAVQAYRQAIALTRNSVARAELQRRLDALAGDEGTEAGKP